jgi:hypothetical protein
LLFDNFSKLPAILLHNQQVIRNILYGGTAKSQGQSEVKILHILQMRIIFAPNAVVTGAKFVAVRRQNSWH